jgi:hypothetical protein
MANWLLVAMLLRISDAARRPAGMPAGPLQLGGAPVQLQGAPTEVLR